MAASVERVAADVVTVHQIDALTTAAYTARLDRSVAEQRLRQIDATQA